MITFNIIYNICIIIYIIYIKSIYIYTHFGIFYEVCPCLAPAANAGQVNRQEQIQSDSIQSEGFQTPSSTWDISIKFLPLGPRIHHGKGGRNIVKVRGDRGCQKSRAFSIKMIKTQMISQRLRHYAKDMHSWGS